MVRFFNVVIGVNQNGIMATLQIICVRDGVCGIIGWNVWLISNEMYFVGVVIFGILIGNKD
jgi:hypothetical protein